MKDNPNDELMTLKAIDVTPMEEIKVVRDGVEALDYLFGKGSCRT